MPKVNVENKELSPGVRRMLALVGAEAPFDHGRQQMKLLADLEVTTKAVERTAEAIGTDLARREQQRIEQAMQLDLPIMLGEPISILYIQMAATGVPVVKAETEGRQGNEEGQPPHTRQAKLGCVFTQTTWDEEGYPIRDPDSTTYVAAIEAAQEFGKRLYLEAWKRGWSCAVKQGLYGRRSRMQLEHCRPVLSRCHTDCRSLPLSRTPLGLGACTSSQRPATTESLDHDPSEQTRSGTDRRPGAVDTLH